MIMLKLTDRIETFETLEQVQGFVLSHPDIKDKVQLRVEFTEEGNMSCHSVTIDLKTQDLMQAYEASIQKTRERLKHGPVGSFKIDSDNFCA